MTDELFPLPLPASSDRMAFVAAETIYRMWRAGRLPATVTSEDVAFAVAALYSPRANDLVIPLEERCSDLATASYLDPDELLPCGVYPPTGGGGSGIVWVEVYAPVRVPSFSLQYDDQSGIVAAEYAGDVWVYQTLPYTGNTIARLLTTSRIGPNGVPYHVSGLTTPVAHTGMGTQLDVFRLCHINEPPYHVNLGAELMRLAPLFMRANDGSTYDIPDYAYGYPVAGPLMGFPVDNSAPIYWIYDHGSRHDKRYAVARVNYARPTLVMSFAVDLPAGYADNEYGGGEDEEEEWEIDAGFRFHVRIPSWLPGIPVPRTRGLMQIRGATGAITVIKRKGLQYFQATAGGELEISLRKLIGINLDQNWTFQLWSYDPGTDAHVLVSEYALIDLRLGPVTVSLDQNLQYVGYLQGDGDLVTEYADARINLRRISIP